MKRAFSVLTLAVAMATPGEPYLHAEGGKKPACCAARAGAAGAKKGESCPADKGEKAASGAHCQTSNAEVVVLTGHLLCKDQAPGAPGACSPVRGLRSLALPPCPRTIFKAEGRQALLDVCPESKDMSNLRTAGGDGKVLLEVKGHLCKRDGKEMFMITSFGPRTGVKAASS